MKMASPKYTRTLRKDGGSRRSARTRCVGGAAEHVSGVTVGSLSRLCCENRGDGCEADQSCAAVALHTRGAPSGKQLFAPSIKHACTPLLEKRQDLYFASACGYSLVDRSSTVPANQGTGTLEQQQSARQAQRPCAPQSQMLQYPAQPLHSLIHNAACLLACARLCYDLGLGLRLLRAEAASYPAATRYSTMITYLSTRNHNSAASAVSGLSAESLHGGGHLGDFSRLRLRPGLHTRLTVDAAMCAVYKY